MEEVVIAGDDELRVVLPCQVDQIVIIGISAQPRARLRVRLDIGSSSDPRQVQLGSWDRDPAAKPRPLGQNMAHLVEQTLTDDQLEGLGG